MSAALSAGGRVNSSTPPAWAWLDGREVPLQVYQHLTSETPSDAELSIHSRNLPESDAKRERNDSSDPTGEDMWPLERDISGSAQVTDAHSNAAPSHRIGTCYLDPDTGETVMPGDFFGEKELRWLPDKTTAPETSSSAGSCVVESCPECGAVTDLDYGTVKDKPPDCQAYGERELDALMAAGYHEMAEDSLDAAEAFIGDDVRFAHETPTNVPVGARSEHTIDDNPLLNHMERTFNSCMDIAVAKNEGYAGSADPMANFKESVKLGVPVPIGVAIRLSDKWSRLCRLLQTGENPLADESITDTIMDAINYLAILLYALEDEG